MARSQFLGKPPKALETLDKVVVEGMQAALDATRAGVSCEAVEKAWRKVLSKAGYEKVSRNGCPSSNKYGLLEQIRYWRLWLISWFQFKQRIWRAASAFFQMSSF